VSDPLVSTQSAIEQLRKADQQWSAAVRALDPYPTRLRALGQAADRESRALRLADLANVTWNPRPGARNIRLAYEVEADSGRPGPKPVWARFDRAVDQLGIALEGQSIRALADAFEQLAALAGELAGAIEIADPVDPPQPQPHRRHAG